MYCASGSMADDRWPDGRWPDGRWPDGRWSSSKPQSCAVVMAHICAHMQVHAHTCTCVHLTGGRLPMAACPTTTHRSKCRMHRTLPSSYRPHHCFKRQAIKVAQYVTASGACTCGRCERASVRACMRARAYMRGHMAACVCAYARGSAQACLHPSMALHMSMHMSICMSMWHLNSTQDARTKPCRPVAQVIHMPIHMCIRRPCACFTHAHTHAYTHECTQAFQS